MVHGLSHITFIVSDIERSARIVTEVLGGREVYDSAGKNFSLSHEKFFDVAGLWIAMMEGAALSDRTYNHVAFKVDESDLPRLQAAIERLGLDMKPPRPRVEGEGVSLYFHDYDNHLFELHTGTLNMRLARYACG